MSPDCTLLNLAIRKLGMAKQYLVVGGNTGIGLEVVKQLSAAGHEVVAALREQDAISGLAGVSTQAFEATDAAAELQLPDQLDGVVYCPGTISLKPFARFSDEDFLADWNVNFMGAVRVIRQAIPALKKSGSGSASIVLFSTVAVQTGLAFHASISAAKGAVEGLTRSLAAELAPKIRVNAIAPSLTDTPLAGGLLGSPEKAEASAQRHPLKRVGDPSEVAQVVRFLLGEDSGFMTGQILQIDGGMGSVRLL